MNEQQTLLQQINILDFTLTEILEFMDTHPNNQMALDYYCHYNQLKKNACSEFARKYYPLTKDEIQQSKTRYSWEDAPLPWDYCTNS